MKRIAIIGYGNIAKKHVEVFRALGCEICSSCNRSPIKNDLAKSESHIPLTYFDYHLMIKEQKPDAIIVAVSFWNMYSVLKDIIPYGIPILAEKPTATSLKEHLDLIELSTKFKTPVMVGLNRRHYSVLENAIELAGGKSAITSVAVEWSENPTHLINNRKLSDDQIKQYVFGNSIHGIDLMSWLAGQISEPQIEVANHDLPFRWRMSVSGKSNSGVLYNFFSDWNSPIPWRIRFTSENKIFIMAPLEQCVVIHNQTKDLVEISEEDKSFKAGFYNQGRRFLDGNHSPYNLASVTESMAIANDLTDKLLTLLK